MTLVASRWARQDKPGGAGALPGWGLVMSHSEDHVVSNEGYKVRPPSMKSV